MTESVDDLVRKGLDLEQRLRAFLPQMAKVNETPAVSMDVRITKELENETDEESDEECEEGVEMHVCLGVLDVGPDSDLKGSEEELRAWGVTVVETAGAEDNEMSADGEDNDFL